MGYDVYVKEICKGLDCPWVSDTSTQLIQVQSKEVQKSKGEVEKLMQRGGDKLGQLGESHCDMWINDYRNHANVVHTYGPCDDVCGMHGNMRSKSRNSENVNNGSNNAINNEEVDSFRTKSLGNDTRTEGVIAAWSMGGNKRLKKGPKE